MTDFLFQGSLSDIDSEVNELIKLETERQYRRLILIPSESTSPLAIRESLGSAFQNIYAEGYPDEDTRWMTQDEILDYKSRLTNYRRYADPRYYKGVEYADVVEALARRRCAETFATEQMSADDLYVNVQPLSGAPANNAVYTALINPGDTILGMNLLHGGHLSHGSSVNRSGKLYNVLHYNVDPKTEMIDYDAIEKIALENNPKIIIAGYSSYPWVPDWEKFSIISKKAGALLMTDISHIAGLVAARVIPSPVGYADIITFTTHKTLCGPRGACIITNDSNISKKIDRGVFPGEQGGPHVHVFAALSTTFKLAQTDQFKKLQQQIVKNCAVLTEQFKKRGLRIPFGGTNTHLGNVDCKSVVGEDGTSLSGDMAARILDTAGIVLNRNTIPGDKTALKASGIRYGTPWVTQRGLKEPEMKILGDIIADILFSIKPYSVEDRKGKASRAKVDFDVLEDAKIKVRKLAEAAGVDLEYTPHGYPHFYYLDDKPISSDSWGSLELSGEKIYHFINYVFSSDGEMLKTGDSQATQIDTPEGTVTGVLTNLGSNRFQLSLPTDKLILIATWLREFSNGFVNFDNDLLKRIPGPIIVEESTKEPIKSASGDPVSLTKPYFAGKMEKSGNEPLPRFTWNETEDNALKRTPLYDNHKILGAKMVPFAGWDMPVWYSSVTEEHLATRTSAGLFDVAHMGVYQVEGAEAALFLDSVCANDISALKVGQSCYTHLLDPDANVFDDLLVYQRGVDTYLVVVNASNDDKDWTWLNAVKNGSVQVDNTRPWARAFGRNAILRNLRDPQEGKDQLINIALQGPKSRDILLQLDLNDDDKKNILALKRTNLCDATYDGHTLVVSRTGYTGEKMAFELFIHPDKASEFWDKLLEVGKEYGLKPCGLGARDSLRTEAGLPLYGHEMGGELGLGVGEAGLSWYVKQYKPWFIGRDSFITREADRKSTVVRFRFTEKGIRMAHNGDPVVDNKGRMIGKVTSCAIDSEGYLTGQAYIENKYAEENTPIAIFQGSPTTMGTVPAELKVGERVSIPSRAIVVSRFPKP